MLDKLKLYFHTIRYLTFTQIKYRIYYALRSRYRSAVKFSYAKKNYKGKSQKLVFEKSLPAAKGVDYHQNRFTFLNLSKQFDEQIDWNEAHHAKLWTYNLNYFEYLHLPNILKEEGLRLIEDFIQKIDVSKNGLEPYPISLRVIHWIKFLTYSNIQNTQVDTSLYQQLWILMDKREYHILGNHLLENGFGLLFGAYYFNDNQLYKSAKNILIKELNEQILADGAHFELSPMYHQLMLYRVLDCYNLVKNNHQFNQDLLPLLKGKAEIMLGWLSQMTFKNGDIPLLNDSAFNINPTTRQLTKYSERLGIKPQVRSLKESGYRKFNFQDYECIVDIGQIGPDYIPGHAHSDTFNFVLYIKGNPFIIDTGLSTYNPVDRRKVERSTNAHNTVQIGNYEQSEIWASFRVARRAYPKVLKDIANQIDANLNYVTTKANHQRTFQFSKKQIELKDNIVSTEEGKAFLHFHPSIEVSLKDNTIYTKKGIIKIEGAKNIQLVNYQYAPEFNQLITAQKAVISFSKSITTTIQL